MSLNDTDIPRLPRGVRLHDDTARGMMMLLGPERAVKLDAVAAAVLSEVDGAKNFTAIVALLAAKYNAPPEVIAADARKFLESLLDKRLLEVAS